MGATDFETLAVGKTVGDAYREAVERAQYDHGHAGYTGTIAEKSGSHLVTLPPRMSAAKFLGWLQNDLSNYDLASYLEWPKRSLEHATGLKRGTEGRGEKILEAKKQIAARTKEFNAYWKKIPPEHHALVRGAALVYNDKWGPALAIELRPGDLRTFRYAPARKRGQKVFLFCGWASC